MKKIIYIAFFLIPLISTAQVSLHFDNIQNGDETGIDCGGSTGRPCVDGKAVTAFDDAYGPGRYATGGRNGDVYVVTNNSNNPATPGSRAYGLATAPPEGRIIVYRIGVAIDMNETNPVITADNITDLGHSCPPDSGGVMIYNGTEDWRGNNWIRRYITYAHGDFGYRDENGNIVEPEQAKTANDTFGVINSENGIADHIMAQWSNDENLSVAGTTTALGSKNITIQYSIIGEALANAISDNGRHPYGSLINLTDTTGIVSYGLNLYIINEGRNPRLSRTFAEMMYNVYYGSLDALVADPGATIIAMRNTWKPANYGSFPNNYVLSETNNAGWGGGPSGGYGKLYFEDNYLVGFGPGLIDATFASDIVATKEDTGIYTFWPDWTREQAIDSVLAKAGPRYPPGNPTISRYLDYYATGGGNVIDTQEQVGGFITIDPGTPWDDVDGDGMDDSLEESFFGDLSQAAMTIAANGRTNIVNLYNSRVDTYAASSAGYTVTPQSGLTTTEAGGTDTFTVVLNEEPNSDVVFGITSNDTGEGTVSPSTLTFTTANWATPQTVTITGQPDEDVDGNVAYTITVSVNDAASDDEYDGLPNTTVNVTNADDDSVDPEPEIGIRARGGMVRIGTSWVKVNN